MTDDEKFTGHSFSPGSDKESFSFPPIPHFSRSTSVPPCRESGPTVSSSILNSLDKQQVEDPTSSEPPSSSPLLSPPAENQSEADNRNSILEPPAITPPPLQSPNAIEFLWAYRLKASLCNLKKISQPTYTEDGIPMVEVPDSIILKTSEVWEGHLIAQFHGLAPPPAKIFADLNPIWGKFGNIIIRPMSAKSCLIFVPSVTTREWIFQVGYWQSGQCAFTVSLWTSSGFLEVPEPTSIPIWAVFKNIPPQLYSLDCISAIASATGEPLHTEKSRLDSINISAT